MFCHAISFIDRLGYLYCKRDGYAFNIRICIVIVLRVEPREIEVFSMQDFQAYSYFLKEFAMFVPA